jgi:DsbC/DsbD-like thiol-disulfide interchange protein
MRIPKPLFLLILILTALPLMADCAAAAAGAWQSNPQSRVRLITPWKVAPRPSDHNGELRLGLHFTLAPGWHVYWKNSGDAGFPPVVVFGKTPGLEKAELLWPAPERFELRGGLVALGYETEVVYPVRATLSPTPDDRLRLSADVDYLVCEVDCIPYRYTVTADQPLGAVPVPDPENAPLVEAWWNRLPMAAEALPGVTTGGVLVPSAGGPVLEVRVRGARPAASPAASDTKTVPGLFVEAHDTFDTGRPEARTTADGVIFRVPLKPHEVGKPLPAATAFAWTATGLVAGGRPVSIEARRTVTQSAGSPAFSIPPPAPSMFSTPIFAPILGALLAVAATIAALWLWGVLGTGKTAGSRPGREALGFAAAAVLCGVLWGMSRQVSFVGLAWIELTLLTMALFAWLRHRAVRRQAGRASIILAVGLVACAAAAPWLAHYNRLAPVPTTLQPIP